MTAVEASEKKDTESSRLTQAVMLWNHRKPQNKWNTYILLKYCIRDVKYVYISLPSILPHSRGLQLIYMEINGF